MRRGTRGVCGSHVARQYVLPCIAVGCTAVCPVHVVYVRRQGCCSQCVLQCVAVCCSVLQCAAAVSFECITCESPGMLQTICWQYVALCRSELHSSVSLTDLPCASPGMLQSMCVALHYSAL